MATGDGNGWVEGRAGVRYWGRFGAAGLALVRTSPRPQVLLQLRAGWTHHGGSWGLVGGARDSHEGPTEAALREAAEEAGVDPRAIRVLGVSEGLRTAGWSYTYVLALADDGLHVGPPTAESDELRWTDLDAVPDMPLHPGLAATWPALRHEIEAALGAAPDLVPGVAPDMGQLHAVSPVLTPATSCPASASPNASSPATPPRGVSSPVAQPRVVPSIGRGQGATGSR